MAATVETPARQRVLIVDDEQVVRAVTRLMLERNQFLVEEAITAADALAGVQGATEPFTLIIVDYTLPDQTGLELIPQLRNLTPQSRLILTSGRPEADFPHHGADGYLAKPYTKEQLLSVVQTILATHQP
ncbi:MAG: response regulator [Gemmataceae bacterium]|nr:response regulator [Gemmata sp.]MDW8197348.1 response regulator [Gemmataceae bacterium]